VPGAEIFIESLRNRVRVMNSLWERAVSDLTLQQINHHERAGVLPLAFSFCHYLRSQDQVISRALLREAPLWEREGWAGRVGVSVVAFGREETVAEMEQLRFADLDAWKQYQARVLARTSSALEPLTAARLAEPFIPALPPSMQHTFCGLVVGVGNPVRVLDALEYFVYQHGLRHMGEVEHGRALVGLGGMTS